MRMIRKTQAAKADVFELKEYLNWNYPSLWHELKSNWNEFYAKDIEIESNVNIKLLRTGEAYRTIRTEWGEST
ncbi:hypothetical protein D3C77_613580 [compost metagenome]